MNPTTKPGRLDLEALADRIVPAVLDLTTEGTRLPVGDAYVQQVDAQPTGTGFIHSFVRVQSAANGSAVTQHGYNTAARPLQFDENKSPSFTRAVTLDDVPKVTVENVAFREFLLDINQKSSAPLLSLDEVRLYLGDAPNLTGYSVADKTLAGLNSVFDLDGTVDGDVSVKLDYRLNHGSGSGDMVLLVPESAFNGASASTYVYLYSKFGGLPGAGANSGFEEWAVRGSGGYGGGNSGGDTGGGVVALNSLSGFVFADVGLGGDFGLGDGIRQDGEQGIAGVTIHLEGTNASGETVHLTALTDANGYYEFVNLMDGTYTLREEQPLGYVDGGNSLGTLGGAMLDDMFAEILLAGGIHGLFYNFGETQTPTHGEL